MENKEFYMKECLDLALKGIGYVAPNPMVGSLIVYKGDVIGKGYHRGFGLNHAEVNAINSVKNKSLLRKSTLYVNLEPCSHFGKTPPCCDMIIKYKMPKVVIGCLDSFSKVAGKGIAKMRSEGIEVVVGVLEKESRELNRRFFTFHEKRRPYIILKWAESKDEFIAPKNQQEPFWMTSSKSKELSHKWRAEEDAILVGRITAEKDNPALTVRGINGNNPIRLVIDKNLKLSGNLNLFNSEVKTIIFNAIKSEENRANQFIRIDFNFLTKNILEELHKQKIQSVIIEGGSKTLQSFIDANMWDEARFFLVTKELKDGVKAPIIEGKILSAAEVDTDFLKIITND